VPLTSGTRIGPYEIVSPLGAGGMGEVYRAHDTKLGRDVALKIVPELLASDRDRLARFTREAQTLAALNHPNIAHIHGLEESGGVRAIVMELVEGEDLAQRLARGPVPVDEALPIARQIAEALEAAHEQGIIHRDLKPANIKVRDDGTVKVLDFGLAKALTGDAGEASSSPATLATSPTVTSPATGVGVVLGTAAYMAPEQAKGKPADTRADIWAFGCVLFEMLAGTRAFHGDDVTETVLSVLSKEPDWQRLPTEASAARPLIARCLTKNLRQRLQAIGDARIQLEELMSGSVEQPASSHVTRRSMARRVAPAAIAALASSALTGALVLSLFTQRGAENPPLVSRFEIVPPPGQPLGDLDFDRAVAVSPDGRFIVSNTRAERRQLAIRAFNGLDVRLLTGTDSANQPFVSPDSQWIGFQSSGSLKKVPFSGSGVAIPICQTGGIRGASWGDDGSIVFASFAGELMRVAEGGGEPTVLTRPDPSKGEARHWHPSILPGGRGILFTITPPDRVESAQVAVLDLKTKQPKTLIRGGSQAEYIPSGHLVYAAANTLRAVRFDLERLQVLSDPVTIVDDVAMTIRGGAHYAFSGTGTLVYVPSRPQMTRSLAWVDRKGREAPIPAPARAYIQPRLSPNGRRIAVAIADLDNDIWLWDLTRRGPLTQLTFDPSLDQHPIWTEDGRIVFASLRGGALSLWVQAADGTGAAEPLTTGPDTQWPSVVLPDGAGIIGTEISPHTAGDIVWFKRAANQSAQATSPGSGPLVVERLVHTKAIEHSPDVSPDGRYIAYESEPGGIYVRPFPRVTDGSWHVSTDGGSRPLWARNGRELFYLDPENKLTAVPVQTSGRALVHGSPVRVLDTAYARALGNSRPYDVSPDGQRFLMIKEDLTAAKPAGLIVVLNWHEELKRLVPAR
jgi:serine/threonine protein kinase